jgi:RNA polymerase sigma-70 factor (ECF subfamily)
VWEATKERHLRTSLMGGLEGDASAYRNFLTGLGDHLVSFLRRRLSGQLSNVEDLVLEVLLAAHNARATYRAEQPVTAWVQAIARYKLVDRFRFRFRSRSRHEAFNDPIDAMEALFEEESSERAEASHRAAGGSVSPRRPFRSRYFVDVPVLFISRRCIAFGGLPKQHFFSCFGYCRTG